MSLSGSLLLIAAGLFAGVVNTLAGAGSLLTVPLLVVLGLPGTVANGTNRIGVLTHTIVAAWRFRAEGVPGFRAALPMVLPIVLGSIAGAYLISLVDDSTFEKLFGIVMIVLLVPLLRGTMGANRTPAQWSTPVNFITFFGIGLYGGAFQAGVGLALMVALAYAGYNLVRANSIKVVIITALTAVAVPIFLFRGQVWWPQALVLAIGYGLGGIIGVRIAVIGGERVIRPVLVASVVALAGRMLGLY